MDGVAKASFSIMDTSCDITCCAENSAGTSQSHCVVTKMLADTEREHRPYFIHPLYDQETEKDSVTLRVVVVATPLPVLHWIVDDTEVANERYAAWLPYIGVNITVQFIMISDLRMFLAKTA